MYNVQIGRKVCATCKWWRGSREISFAGARMPQYVQVDNIVPAGHTCVAWRVERGATHACNRWSKWEKM